MIRLSLPLLSIFIFLGSLCLLQAQGSAGINTTAPNGMLDINSSVYGVVFPRVVLTKTNISAPIVNPDGAESIVNGTIVYNTNTTSTGVSDVSPGKYYWKDTQWVPMFERKQSQLFTQDRTPGASPPVDGFAQRVSANGSTVTFENIKGLTNQTFIPTYTGTYRLRAILNYGAGFSDPAAIPEIVNFNIGKGDFKVTFNGVDYLMHVNSFAGRNASANPIFFAIYKEPAIVKYVQLTAGIPYTLNVSFDQYLSHGLVNDSNSGTGRGLVGVLNPSYVEITFIE